jgi:MFS family permease
MSDPHLQGVVLGPFLPFLPIFVAEQLELPQSFTGLYRTVGLISMVVSPIVLGAVLSDGRRAKPAVVLGMLGTPLAAGLFVARQPTLMVAVAVAQGVLDGVITSAGKSYMVLAAPEGRLGACTAVYFIGSTLGSALGSAAGGLLLAEAGPGSADGGFGLLGGIMLALSLPLVAIASCGLPAPQQQPTPSAGAPAREPAGKAPTKTGLLQFCAFVGRPRVLCLAAWQCLRTVGRMHG